MDLRPVSIESREYQPLRFRYQQLCYDSDRKALVTNDWQSLGFIVQPISLEHYDLQQH